MFWYCKLKIYQKPLVIFNFYSSQNFVSIKNCGDQMSKMAMLCHAKTELPCSFSISNKKVTKVWNWLWPRKWLNNLCLHFPPQSNDKTKIRFYFDKKKYIGAASTNNQCCILQPAFGCWIFHMNNIKKNKKEEKWGKHMFWGLAAKCWLRFFSGNKWWPYEPSKIFILIWLLT